MFRPDPGFACLLQYSCAVAPRDDRWGPKVHDLLMGDSTAQQQVEEPQRLRRDPGDVEQLVREHGDIKPYIDPVLSSSRRHYVAFCRRMLKVGLCRPSFRMEEVVGVFFLRKKVMKMRVILDTGRTNR